MASALAMSLLAGCSDIKHGFAEERETILLYDPNVGG